VIEGYDIHHYILSIGIWFTIPMNVNLIARKAPKAKVGEEASVVELERKKITDEARFINRITHRSVGAGINEIFVESDELEAVKNLGNLVKIVYSEEVLILKTRRNEL
jgi:hypothetical protein